MKPVIKLAATLAVVSATLGGPSALACTGGALSAKDGGTVVGRTLEFGVSLDSQIVVWPKGSAFTGSTPSGNNGIKFTSKYGFMGATVGTHYDMLVDGMNEQGLNVGVFYFPGYADYAKATQQNTSKGLSPGQFSTWMLANFATVDEVKANIDKVAVLAVELDLLKAVPDIHFKVQDATGKAITIEPVNGELKVYDNPVRVLTNSPGFEFHMTNLNNYLNITPNYLKPKQIGDLTLQPFGMGAGAVGLPGDITPPSRFLRMVFYTQNVPEQPTSQAAVSTLFHLLNNFDIPYGSSLPPPGSAETDPEITTWTAVSDLKNLQFHWKTYGHQNVRVIDLKQALQEAGSQMISREMGPQTANSVSPSTPATMK